MAIVYRDYDTNYTVIEPSDSIYITDECDTKLLSLWHDLEEVPEGYYPYVVPPTDIIESRTVSLPNFYLTYTKYPEPILINTNERGVLMVLPTDIILDYRIDNGTWTVEGMPGANCSQALWDRFLEDEEASKVLAYSALDTWYGIQISLLHPQIQMLFKTPSKEKIYKREGSGKDRKRVVKYVHKHYITPEGIDEALYGHGHRDFERKTMAWYVIGHWRQYKNGTRKFINGYWKGPLREMKRNLDGGRIRQLVVQEV